MRLTERAFGFELSPQRWRAVYLEDRLRGTRVLGEREGELAEPEETANSAAQALEDACRSLGVAAGARLGIALVRPLAHVKRVRLARGARSDLVAEIRQQAATLFPIGRRAVIADLRRPRRNGHRLPADEGVMAAAPEEVIEALAACAESLGLRFATADLAAGAVRVVLPRGVGSVLFLRERGLEWVDYGETGALERSWYFPVSEGGPAYESIPGLLAGDLAERVGQRKVMLLGPEEAISVLRDAWAGPGIRIATASSLAAGTRQLSEPSFVPAYAAGLEALGAARAFDLRPDRFHRADAVAGRRRTAALAAVLGLAVALYTLTGFLQLRSQVGVLEREAERVRPQAEEVLELRQSIVDAAQQADVLTQLETTQPRWTSVLAEVARTLPSDAYLTAIIQREGSLRMEGYAETVSAVVSSLETSAMLSSVRLAGPVIKENTPAGERERFVLEVSLVRTVPEP